MIRTFLSHSSFDKDNYVRLVANSLGYDRTVYDEYTFEFGMRNIEEIMKGMNDSQLFVVFLSEKALESKWVRKELYMAYQKLATKQLERIFPIIIDINLLRFDERIPNWMKDEYNLKYVARPTIAARRIRQKLREISWLRNPKLKDRDMVFVGRNSHIAMIEERVDDFNNEIPSCLIATGLPRIGKSSLLRHALIKGNIVSQSYEFPSIVLFREDSLDDLILKLFDLGLSTINYPANLMSYPIEKKKQILEEIVDNIQSVSERIIIHDHGAILTSEGIIQPWFIDILQKINIKQQTTFLISSRFRVKQDELRNRQFIFAISVPELNMHERNGLFKRFLDIEGISITRDDFSYFVDQFHGYPDQIQYAIELILNHGIQEAKNESHQLTEFNTEKVQDVLKNYNEKPEIIDFLYLLSEFEFISLDFLFNIVNEEEYYVVINEFISTNICDFIGIEKEFIRLNDVIRDYVRRNRLSIPEQFKEKLSHHIDMLLTSDNEEERDISDLLYTLKEGIKIGRDIPEKYLVPSYFLRSIKELYQERGHLDRVIQLADKLIEKQNNYDNKFIQNVRYYLCLSLARKKDSRMLKEVQKIHGPEHNFLLGFYYRLQGRANDAIDSLSKCMDQAMVSSRAKRELVQVYLLIEEYELASKLAEENYEENRRNQFHIQAYFNSIVNSQNVQEKRELLLRLIDELRSIDSDIAPQMADLAYAEFLAKCECNYGQACDIIEDAIGKYNNTPYPLLAKAFLAARFYDRERLHSALIALERMSKEEQIIYADLLIKIKAYLYILDGQYDKGVKLAEIKLSRLPDFAKQNFIQKLNNMHENINRN